MDASIVDLRYHMADVLKALKRGETVRVYQRKSLVGYLAPARPDAPASVKDHPFFGSAKGDKRPVEKMIRRLRKNRMKRRFRDL